MSAKPIYLDYHAHSPIDPRVLKILTAAYTELDANPHSRHLHGDQARIALDAARSAVAGAIGASARDVVFTSGATEANNLVFAGLEDEMARRRRRRIVVASTEHASVLAAANRLGARGFDVVHLPVRSDGSIEEADVEAAATDDTGIVSVALANHETGVIQPVAALSAIAKRHGALFHSDLAQALGKVPVDAADLDLASMSAHKACGPTGIGALFVSRRARKGLSAAMLGGGQENGARSGTVPVALCVAFAAACKHAADGLVEESVRVGRLRDRLLAALIEVGGIRANGRLDRRLAGNINVSIEGVDGEALTMRVADRLSISTGSACHARSLEPSHVLTAMGFDRNRAESAVRIGLGRFTTEAEIGEAAAVLCAAITALRAVGRRSAA